MEDKKKKKEDKKKRDASQKATEQKVKVPESTKPSSQSVASPGSVSPSPGPAPSSSPCPAAGVAVPPGGNNAKRAAVANGQPPTGTQPTQRYMPREVPPRFRCQQDHKVLLKRGQPPLSCMLLGGSSGRGDTPPFSQGEAPNATTSAATDSNLGSPSPSPPHSSPSLSVTASSSTYANSTWGVCSGSQPPSQGWEKVIVDGSDHEEWPSIVGLGRAGTEGGEPDGSNNNNSASWSDKSTQQLRDGGSGVGSSDSSSSPHTSPTSLTECVQPSVMWGSSSQPGMGGLVSVTTEGSVLYNSTVSVLPGTRESLSVHGGIPGANFNPNANSSAWPGLVQGETTGFSAANADGLRASITSSSASTSPTLPLPSVSPASHQHQHEMPARDGECRQGDWKGMEQELGAGPNQEGLDLVDSGVVGGSGNLSSSSSSTTSSSWRAVAPASSNLHTGASGTDPWDRGGGDGTQELEANVWGFDSQREKAESAGDEAWETEKEGSSNTPVVSQGAWEGGAEEVWGSAQGTTGIGASTSLAKGSSGGAGSSSSGGSIGEGISRDSASPTLTSVARPWDNQKGVGDEVVEDWAGQGGGGAEGPSSSSGGGSRAGSHNPHQEHIRHRSSNQAPNPEVALQSMLSRPDLDPRVLSNTGWGQTQVRQNVAWDLDTDAVGQSEGISSSTFSSAAMNTTGRASAYPVSGCGAMTSDSSARDHMLTVNIGTGPGPSRGGWDDEPTSSVSSSIRSPAASGMPGEDRDGNPGKMSGGWGDISTSESQGKSWGSEEQEWRERRGGGGSNWRDPGEQGGTGGGGWPGGPEEKGTVGGWKEMGKEGGGWGQRGGAVGEWGQREHKPVSGGWVDGRGRGGGSTDEGSWVNMDEGGPHRSWGGGGSDVGGKAHQNWGMKPQSAPTQNSHTAPMKAPNQHQHQLQHPPGGLGRAGGPPTQNQNQSSGWTAGPIPQIPSGPVEAPEPSGWEEPSPQSISRKMEIDDGTSAWGDPTRYNSKNVNLWDKNSAPSGQPPPHQAHPAPSTSLQHPPPRRQPGNPANRDSNPSNASGQGPGMWGGASNLAGQSVDNGTASWGPASDAPTGWGDPDHSSKPTDWGNASSNSGTKSVQEGWGKGNGPVSASRHASWDEEDDGGAVWNSAGSQGSSNSYNCAGWGQGGGGKRGSTKAGGGDNWMNPMSRQFQNMGLMGEDSSLDKKLEGDKRGINDYNGEMRRGRGGYRMPSSKDMGPGDMGPYNEKMSGHGVFSGSSGMPPSRGMHQQGMHPINPSQGFRAQVPHQFLSAQGPGPMLKQMPSPGSSVGGVFPPQLSPQQLAVLSNLYPHVQQFHLACQLLLQQQQQQQQQQHQQQQQQQQQQLLQNQRKLPQSVRQQPDPQQLARIMAILQQQRQQQQGGVGGGSGPSKLSPSHLGGPPKQPMADPMLHPGMVGPLSELHAKTQGMYSGLASGGNLSGLELSSMLGGVKDGGQQSRFKWMMDGHSPDPSPPDAPHHKNGPSMPVKVGGGSPYSHYELLGVDGLGMPPQGPSDNWQRTPGSKMGTKTGTSCWPPEFQPGVPWKGAQSADPESDPYITPGSVLASPGPSSLSDSDHQLLRDNTGPNPPLNTSLPSPGAWPYSASENSLSNAHSSAKYSEYKTSWPPEPIGHNKPWKTNRSSSQLPRPPPGLTSQKQTSSSPWGSGGQRLARGWGGGGPSQDSRFGPGSAWSDGAASRGSCWLLLSNLTPQIDGSTLRTICMQHGPLLTFHLGLTQGSALIRYSTRQEAAKAQGALHMCVLGNTTILAEFVNEEEVARYFAHSQAGAVEGTSPGVGAGQGPSGTGPAVGSSGGSSPRSERPAGGAGTTVGGNGNSGGGGVLGGVGHPGSGWQNLDGTGSSPEASSAQGPGLGIFAQWSTNGAVDTARGGIGAAVEAGRSGLWGGVTPAYPSSSSLWGVPQMDDRLQMSSPAGLLPGDLLGGGADSI